MKGDILSMNLTKTCFFRMFGVCIVALVWCQIAFSSPTGGDTPGQSGFAISCDTAEIPDGYIYDGNGCIPCPAGYTCQNGTQSQSRCSFGYCAANVGGSCVNSGAVQCKPCPSGTYSNSTRTSCSACENVEEYLNDSNECESCPTTGYNTSLYTVVHVDGYNDVRQCGLSLNSGFCSVYTVKWYYNGRGGVTWELMDDSSVAVDKGGEFYVKDPAPSAPDTDWCGQCENGKFNISGNAGAEACVSCPAGYCIHNDTGVRKCIECAPGHYCPAGNDGNAQTCTLVDDEGYGIVGDYECRKGTYSGTGQAECTPCASGYTTSGVGTKYIAGAVICKKQPIVLRIGDDIKTLPEFLKQGKVNKSVLTIDNSGSGY